MKSFIIFISAYFVVAACTHRLSTTTTAPRRILAWVGLTIGLTFSCGILIAIPAMIVVTGVPVCLCMLGGFLAARFQNVAAKIGLIVVGVGLAVAFHLQFAREMPQQYVGVGNLAGCEQNLRDLGDALQRYRQEHPDGKLQSLKDLMPGFLKEIPRCPAGRRVTYVWKEGREIVCQGHFHRASGVPENHPRWRDGEVFSGRRATFNWYEFE